MKSLFLNIFTVMFCCVACLPGTSSETASVVNIKFPSSLPEAIKNGGYSVCFERVDTSDSSCTKSFLNHKKISDTSVDLDVDSACSKGYKMKMWLWSDSSTHKPVYGINPKKSDSTYTYRDGYVIIDSTKLQESSLILHLNLGKVSASSGSSSTTDANEWTNVLTDIIKGGSSGSSLDSVSSTTISSSSSCNHENNIKDEAKGSSDSGAGSSSGSGSEPTGSIIQLGSKAPDIKASKYPSMVMYTFTTNCSPCEQLKSWAKSNLSSFKGKIHVYQNDVPYGETTAGGKLNCSKDTPRPVVEFYDKSGTLQTSDCIVGFDSSSINSTIQKLTN